MQTKKIFFYSTNQQVPEVSFQEALLNGLAPDKGLYMPTAIPKLHASILEEFSSLTYAEIAVRVLSPFLSHAIPTDDLRRMCEEAYTFEIPVERVADQIWVLRLDRGPTASFKDFAARLMAKMMNYFMAREGKHLVILTATSGDTGSAVASAFYGLDSIDVVVLFPEKEVTEVQRRQMTTLHKNIHILSVKGKFDHCQALVKQAFTDPDLAHLHLSSANSINIGRLLPQAVYYYYAWSRIRKHASEEIIFSVPSGNFGNLMGGIIARETGLPVKRFVVATNANKEVPEYLKSGVYQIISPSLTCISSAMNVGHPSNMARVVAIYGGQMDEKGNILQSPDLEKMRKDFWGVSVSDQETLETIQKAYAQYQLLLEPHGAVAWNGAMKFLVSEYGGHQPHPPLVVIETAHPGKFPEEIQKTLGFAPPVPDALKHVLSREEAFLTIENEYTDLKKFILDTFYSV